MYVNIDKLDAWAHTSLGLLDRTEMLRVRDEAKRFCYTNEDIEGIASVLLLPVITPLLTLKIYTG